MRLNIREMIDGTPIRLRYVFRYSTSRVACPESVAEHSYFVAFYCLMIGKWVDEQGEMFPEVNMEKLLTRALLHDLEEARSGDFPRPFKHSNEALKEMLERASLEAFKQTIYPMFDVTQPTVSRPSLVGEFISAWSNSKDDTLEGRILEFADFLSVLGFLMQENDSGANRSIKAHVGDMTSYFQKFSGPAYAFLAPLVSQAEALMKEVFLDPQDPTRYETPRPSPWQADGYTDRAGT